MTTTKNWLLVDGDYLLTYLWFRGPEVTQQFWLEMAGLISEFQALHVAIAWDSRKDRRRAIIPHYKRNRIVPEEWRQTKPQLKEEIIASLEYLPVVHGSVEGLEADDLIWCWHNSRTGVIATGDRDLWQCLKEDMAVWSPRKHLLVTHKHIEKEYGSKRAMIIQRCLVGDQSDGLKGVEGIGPKRARELWEKYPQDLENMVVANCQQEVSSDDRWLQKVQSEQQTAHLNWQVIKIGELIVEDDLDQAESLLKQPVKLFDVDAARFYCASQGWFNVLKFWPQVAKAYQQVLA